MKNIKKIKVKCPKRGCKSERFKTKGIDIYNNKQIEYKECSECGTTFKLYSDIIIIPSKIESVDKSIVEERYNSNFELKYDNDFID